MENTNPGNVYVFNDFSEDAILSVNVMSAGTIAGWKATDPKYTPFQAVVPRSKYPTDKATFVSTEDNAVTIKWTSYTGSIDVKIPADQLLTTDLILHICLNDAVLMGADGRFLTTYPVNLTVKAESVGAAD